MSEKNEKLTEARMSRRWTQAEVAEKVGTSQVNVNRWEQGKNRPGPYYRKRLADLFGVSEEELGLTSPAGPVDLAPVASQSSGERTAPFDQDRQRMIERISNQWISGVLDHSLVDGRLINLHLRMLPGAIVNPWAEAVQESILPEEAVPEAMHIIDAYDHAGGALLILGEPGSGKTTSLLEITRDLLERAKADGTLPLPVVFNLSSWAEKRLSIPTWMIEELNHKYYVPRQLAEKWVAMNQILPLLDGLDEVVEMERRRCVEAINVYRKERGFLSMVVCSRQVEYRVLDTPLALGGAIAIEPLTEEQIEEYITAGGKELKYVKTTFLNDVGLKELASTPLMLRIIVLAFQSSSLKTLAEVTDPFRRRNLIFQKYVEVVLQYRGPKKRYLPEQTQRWLSWLAQHMQTHNQTVFHLERIQPDCLSDDRTRLRYRNTVTQVVFGLNCFVSAALFACFRGDSAPTRPGLFFWLGAAGKGNEILEWMRPGLANGLAGAGSLDLLMIVLISLIALILNLRKIPTLSRSSVTAGLLGGLRNGLLAGGPIAILSVFIFSSSHNWGAGLYRGIITGLFSGLLIFLITGLVTSLRYGEPHNRIHLPVHYRLVNGIIFGFCGIVSFVFIYWLQAGELDLALKYGVVVGGSCLIYAFSDSMDLIRGLGTRIEPAETIAWSWRDVKTDLRDNTYKGSLVTLFVLTITVIVFAGVSSLSYGFMYGVRYGLIYGVIVGLITGVTTLLTQVLTSGWSSAMLSKDKQIRPNGGIIRSVRNSLIAGLISGPIGGLVSGVAIALAFKLIAGLSGWPFLGGGFALVLGIEFALQVLMAYGGISIIEHYTLRWYLWRDGKMPLNAVLFLDYAAGRILLQKVGGGYMFSHRLLLEYFSTLQEEGE